MNDAGCNLQQIDFEAAQNEVEITIQSNKKRGTYVVCTPKGHFEIGKYAVENGTSKAVLDTNQDSRRWRRGYW